jgi:very-short-patch-repair endonuclease
MAACLMQPEQTIRRARRLRKTPTRAEEFFWSLVRDRALDGLRFRRQVPIGLHVIDFACLSARLIIEADGGVHALRTFDDAKRDSWLTSQGFQVLRFPNADIPGKPNDVLAAIRDAAHRPPSVRLRPPPSPEMGEGVRGA